MKKLSTIITAAVLAFGTFSAMSISASACGRHNSNTRYYTPAASGNYGTNTSAVNTVRSNTLHYFIDSNNDSICDNCSSGVCLPNGSCSSYFHEHGIFIDNNNDGICDNYAAGVCTQHGYHHTNGNFVDSDNDGICDNCANGTCTQHGTGLSYYHKGGCHR